MSALLIKLAGCLFGLSVAGAEHCCIVWPRDGKWSAYCTYEGSLWFEKFDSAAEAKEQCMKLLDVVMPNHPAMLARAVLAKAQGAQQ